MVAPARRASSTHEPRSVTSGSSTSTRETFSISSISESRSATPPRSIQEAASGRSIRGFDTGGTPPPSPRSGSSENVSSSGGIHMDLGMLPSCILYPPGQRASRRRVLASPQEPERGKIGGGDGQAQVGWIIPFSADSRQSNAYQQDSKSPERVYNATRNLETR
ncbi:hypothetical protein BD779DRAFT_1528692 [Infundibulicybe gibba]|nr:hypothetical protein BD779DRAFT_1528692 [Infundibulicybe gibba]